MDDRAQTGSAKDASYCHASLSQGSGAFGFTEEPCGRFDTRGKSACSSVQLVEVSNLPFQMPGLKGLE